MWYKSQAKKLFCKNKNPWELNEEDLSLAAKAYSSLLEIRVNYRTRNVEQRFISVGYTSAAKVLFAIRPKALIPWDKKIREKLGYNDGSEESYLNYLMHAKT